MAPSLVLLHGFSHTGASWNPVIAALVQRYRSPICVLAPDIRGHGAASDRLPVCLGAILEDLAGLAPPSFTLVGYSMGGRLALHAALGIAERIERLVLIGASPGLEDPVERRARRAADESLAGEIEQGTIEAFAKRWQAIPVLAGQPPELQATVRRDRLRNTPEGLARALRGLGTGALPPLWGRLGELRVPVSLVVGERDRKFSSIAREMVRRLPSAELRIVPNSGHAVHLEAPGEIARILAG